MASTSAALRALPYPGLRSIVGYLLVSGAKCEMFVRRPTPFMRRGSGWLGGLFAMDAASVTPANPAASKPRKPVRSRRSPVSDQPPYNHSSNQ